MFASKTIRTFRAVAPTAAAAANRAVRAAAAAVPFETLENRQMYSAGSLDASFSNDGKVATGMGGQDYASAVYVDVNGRTLVAGSSDGNMVLARYTKGGKLDTSFGGGDGKVTIDFGADESARAVTADYGHITVVGSTNGPGTDRFAVARLKLDGTLDKSFDGDGRKVFNFSHDTGYGGGATEALASSAVGVQNRPDGTIVVGGTAYVPVPAVGQYDSVFALARLKADGSFDNAFGTNGKVTHEFGGYHNAYGHQEAQAMAVMPDGRIVLGGRSNYSFGVSRFLPNGNVDNSWGYGGDVTTDLAGNYEVMTSLAVGPDNTLVAGGHSSLSPGVFSATLVKYDVNGNLDHSFSGDGVMYTPLGSEEKSVDAVAVQPDGKILSVASGEVLGNTVDLVVTRLNKDGTKDTSFGFGGFAVVDFGGQDYAAAVSLAPGGKIVVAGQRNVAGNADFAVARLNGNVPTFTITRVKDAIEGKQDGVFKIERDGDPYGFDPVTIKFEVLGNAILGTDYTLTPSIAQNGLTFMTGQSTMLVTVKAKADGKTEGIETVTLKFKPDAAYDVDNEYAYVLITDK